MRTSRLRGLGVGALVLVVLLGLWALRPAPGARADTATGLPVPEPDLSLPAIPKGIQTNGSSFVMLGADSAGEAFAYTMELPGQPALAQVNGRPVPSDCNPGNGHFVIYTRTATDGWHLTQEALDPAGAPIPGFRPTGYYTGAGVTPAGSVAPGGAAAIAGTTSGSSGPQVILVRDPGGSFRAAPAPPASVLAAPNTLYDPSAPVLAAVDDPGHGGVFVAPAGGSFASTPPDFVLHYDGVQWTAEPILAAPGGTAVAVQRVIAISDTSPANAYMLAQGTAPGAGVELYRRETSGSGAEWVRVTLDGAQGALYAVAAGGGYSGLGPLYPEDTTAYRIPKALAAPGSQALTATAGGTWIDGGFTDSAGTQQRFTLSATVTERSDGPHAALHAWCTEAVSGLCDDTVGALPGGYYRSMAWPGGGPYGQRILTGMPGGGILSLQGTAFAGIDGPGNEALTNDGSAAFISPSEGWTGGAPATHFTTTPAADPVQAWPAPFREPLTAIAGEPGKTPGAIDAQALAVGANGEVARYTPGLGWAAEPLLTAAGVRATPTLRGVAWPEAQFAYAVGDGGQMWRYDSVTGLWQSDPAKPLNFIGDLTAVAFDPADPTRGYAVGLDGVLLSYGKSWSQDPVPAGLEHANFTSVTFAGSEAIAAFQTAQPPSAGGPPAAAPSSGLLINTGSGWQLDTQEQQLTAPPPSTGSAAATPPAVSVVAGLPDGGAVAAGDGVLLERDSAAAPWRLARDPLPGYSVVAAAAIRVGPTVQALLSVDPDEPQGRWPDPSAITAPPCVTTNTCTGDQGLPVLFGAYDIPANGWLVRETPTGWQDVQRNAYPADYAASGPVDNPARDDEVQALLVDPTGTQGWAVGGESGIAPTDNQASSSAAAAHLHTAGIYRYPASATPPTGATQAPPALSPSQVTVALAGDATCLSSCATRDTRAGLGPPMWIDHAVASAAALSTQPGGPRAFVYTGGIVPPVTTGGGPSDPAADQSIAYFAAHTHAAAGALPFAPVISSGELSAGAPASSFMSAFAPPPGVRGNFPDYYAFDVAQAGAGTLRVLVIDDVTPSAVRALASADTTDAQYQFVINELTSARASHIPTIVVGSATLSTLSVTGQAAPTGAGSIAALLVANGVSAYFFESPNSNAQYRIPAGAPQTIPAFGTGSLSYQAWANSGNQFGESGYLLASVDVAHTDPVTNRAPVSVRLIPNISELAIDALDGTVLQRSEVALFSALARRPRGGTGQPSSGALVGPDPYIAIPPATCSFACSARINPEYTFTSSHPDIGNFVAQDPASQNPRAVFIGPDEKPVIDNHSGLFCAFNAGKTTVTVTTGGLSFSETITVLGGQIRFPCGTTPLINPPVKVLPAPNPGTPAPLPGATPLPVSAAPPPPPPPAPVPAAPAPPAPVPAVHHAFTLPVPQPPPVIPFVPRPAVTLGVPAVPLTVPPPPPPPSFPSGFSGVPVPITQPASAPEERKEEEHATEEAQNFSAYSPGQGNVVLSPALAVAMVIVLAGAGTTLRVSLRTRRRRAPAYAYVDSQGPNTRVRRRI